MSNVSLIETCTCGARIDVMAGTVFTENQARLFREAHAACRDRLLDWSILQARLIPEGEEE